VGAVQQLGLDELAGFGDKQGHYCPITWNGYWNMTSIGMLTNLQPVPAK